MTFSSIALLKNKPLKFQKTNKSTQPIKNNRSMKVNIDKRLLFLFEHIANKLKTLYLPYFPMAGKIIEPFYLLISQ